MTTTTNDTTTPTDIPADRLWDIQEAAYYLNMCDDTARKNLEHVAVRFGPRNIRYFASDVIDLALSLRGTKPAERQTSVMDTTDGYVVMPVRTRKTKAA